MQSFNYFEPLNCNHDNYVGLLQVSLFVSGTHLWFSGAKSENYFPPFLEWEKKTELLKDMIISIHIFVAEKTFKTNYKV